MPDITYLPVLAEYFKVSIDQLMGIVPLNGEEYIAMKTGTGIDLAEKLLELGERLLSETDYETRFIHKDVYDYHASNKYDLVICQAVLRHLDTPDAFFDKMIEFAKEGAWIICIDSNREFECDGLYVDGMDYFSLCRHEGLEKNWKAELEQQGRDYAAAIRNAHRMRKAGLKDVAVRMNDRVNFVTPQREDYEQTKQDFIKYNDWNADLSTEEKEKIIQFLMTHGMSRKEAAEYCNRNIEIADFFQKHPDVEYTFVKGTMIAYGKK